MSFDRSHLIALFLLSFSTLVIASAWGFELIGGYQPCGLCLQQRQPYYLAMPVAALTLYLVHRTSNERLIKILFALFALIFAASLFLAIRHMGVEWKWWLGPANCAAGDLGNFGQGGSLIDALENNEVAFCDEAAARFLGLSFAGWNAVSSLILIGAAIYGYLSINKKAD